MVSDLTDLLVAQHFAKCPMFEHLKHFTPFAGQLSLEWFWRCPYLRHPGPFCWLKGFFGLGIDCRSLWFLIFVFTASTVESHRLFLTTDCCFLTDSDWRAISVRSGSSYILTYKLASFILMTILSRIISSRRSLYPQCSDNVQSEVTKFSLSSCFHLLNFTLSKITFRLTMKIFPSLLGTFFCFHHLARMTRKCHQLLVPYYKLGSSPVSHHLCIPNQRQTGNDQISVSICATSEVWRN